MSTNPPPGTDALAIAVSSYSSRSFSSASTRFSQHSSSESSAATSSWSSLSTGSYFAALPSLAASADAMLCDFLADGNNEIDANNSKNLISSALQANQTYTDALRSSSKAWALNQRNINGEINVYAMCASSFLVAGSARAFLLLNVHDSVVSSVSNAENVLHDSLRSALHIMLPSHSSSSTSSLSINEKINSLSNQPGFKNNEQAAHALSSFISTLSTIKLLQNNASFAYNVIDTLETSSKPSATLLLIKGLICMHRNGNGNGKGGGDGDEDASVFFKSALKLDNSLITPRRIKVYDEAYRLLTSISDGTFDNNEDKSKAVLALKQLSSLNLITSDHTSLHLKGCIQYLLADYQSALTSFQDSLNKSNSEYEYETVSNMARCYVKLGMFEVAVEVLLFLLEKEANRSDGDGDGGGNNSGNVTPRFYINTVRDDYSFASSTSRAVINRKNKSDSDRNRESLLYRLFFSCSSACDWGTAREAADEIELLNLNNSSSSSSSISNLRGKLVKVYSFLQVSRPELAVDVCRECLGGDRDGDEGNVNVDDKMLLYSYMADAIISVNVNHKGCLNSTHAQNNEKEKEKEEEIAEDILKCCVKASKSVEMKKKPEKPSSKKRKRLTTALLNNEGLALLMNGKTTDAMSRLQHAVREGLSLGYTGVYSTVEAFVPQFNLTAALLQNELTNQAIKSWLGARGLGPLWEQASVKAVGVLAQLKKALAEAITRYSLLLGSKCIAAAAGSSGGGGSGGGGGIVGPVKVRTREMAVDGKGGYSTNSPVDEDQIAIMDIAILKLAVAKATRFAAGKT